MNKEKEYVKNTIILLIGKFSTQFMSIFMLPLYTYYLDATDYGTIDLLQSYISLFVPILILRFDSAVFRFLIDNRKNSDGKKNIISNVIVALLIQILTFILIIFIIRLMIDIKYFWYMLANIIAIMMSHIVLQISRGLGKNKEYATGCVISTATIVIINIILIMVLNGSASSILISSAIANITCCIYLVFKNKLYKYIEFNLCNKNTIKELLRYSLPMIPNSLSWWIVNISDRTIISLVIGTFANGIYAVSCKFSNLLNNIFSVFSMSWQETASLHINDEDKDEFFTDMINKILVIFISISILIISSLPFVFNIIIGEGYRSSYNYIPILLLANIFNVIIGLLGGIYVAKKLTKQIANTTMVAAVVNIIINVLFIRTMGLYATCMSSVIAYSVMAIYRYIDVQKYVKIKLDYKKLIYCLLLFISCFVTYYINNVIINIVMLIIIIISITVLNKRILISGYELLKNKITRKEYKIEE